MHNTASQYAVASPCGTYIASVTQQHLYVQWANSLAPAFTFPLDDQAVKPKADAATLQWSAASSHVILISSQAINIFSLQDTALKTCISNGSGGLGKIIATDILGGVGQDQIMVLWEFGRVNFWDLNSGKGVELGEAKTGGRGTSWAVRRRQGKTEVLALLSRSTAQDRLSFFLPPNPAPLRSIDVPSSDAQSITWSECGQWLAVLDSALASPSVYIYTADGYPFRSYPATTLNTLELADTVTGLGHRSLAWTTSSLALATSTDITILDSRTFSHKIDLHLSDINAATGGLDEGAIAYQENITSTGSRSYAFLTGSSVPRISPKASIIDVRSNIDGKYLSSRDENTLTTITIWDLERKRPHLQLLQHAPIRKTLWHPLRANLIMITSEDGALYLWDVTSGQAPVHIQHTFSGRTDTSRVEARWVAPTSDSKGATNSTREQKLAILVTTRKSGWQVIWPEGCDETSVASETAMADVTPDGDVSQDSLYEILSGRTPLPELKTKTIDMDETTGSSAAGLDDTFREKKGQAQTGVEDDSEIF